MIAVAVLAGEGWYAMQIYDDKKRFVHYNLFFYYRTFFLCCNDLRKQFGVDYCFNSRDDSCGYCVPFYYPKKVLC